MCVQVPPTCISHRDLGTSSSRSRSSVLSADARGTPEAPDVALHAPGTWTPHTSGTSWPQTSTKQRWRQQQQQQLPACHPLPEKQKQQGTRPRQHWFPVPRRRLRGSSHMEQHKHSWLAALPETTTAILWILKLQQLQWWLCAGDGSHQQYWLVWSFSESCHTGGCRGTLGSGSALAPLAALGGPGRPCRSCGRKEARRGPGTSPGRLGRWAPLAGLWTALTGPRPCQYDCEVREVRWRWETRRQDGERWQRKTWRWERRVVIGEKQKGVKGERERKVSSIVVLKQFVN